MRNTELADRAANNRRAEQMYERILAAVDEREIAERVLAAPQ